MFSLTRTDANTPKCLTYFECGIKNKRRIMEDRTSLYENINIFHQPFLSNCHQAQCVQKSIVNGFLSPMPDALVAVFDGHCGSDCAQYVSSHLPLTIIQNSELKLQSKENYENSIEKIFRHSFTIINERFTEKALEEVNINRNIFISFNSIKQLTFKLRILKVVQQLAYVCLQILSLN
jgi:serine/threonine protein phosphatase PrpC